MFYASVFRMKFWHQITKLRFGFEICWRQNFLRKTRVENVDEIDSISQFHQC